MAKYRSRQCSLYSSHNRQDRKSLTYRSKIRSYPWIRCQPIVAEGSHIMESRQNPLEWRGYKRYESTLLPWVSTYKIGNIISIIKMVRTFQKARVSGVPPPPIPHFNTCAQKNPSNTKTRKAETVATSTSTTTEKIDRSIEVINEKESSPSQLILMRLKTEEGFPIASFPNEILRNIIDELNIIDATSLRLVE